MKSIKWALVSLALVFASVIANAAPRVLIVVTSHDQLGSTGEKTGLWLSEMTHPYHELTQAGIEVDLASIQGGAAPIDPRSLGGDDPVNNSFMADPATRRLLDNTLRLSDVDPSSYEGVLFAGGHGSMWDFPESKAVDAVGSAIYENGGYVAAVCHGPAALLNIHGSSGELLIKGKRVAGFSNAEEEAAGLTEVMPYLLQDELIAGGAVYSEGEMFTSHVVTDGRLMTGQNPQSAAHLGKALAQALKPSAD